MGTLFERALDPRASGPRWARNTPARRTSRPGRAGAHGPAPPRMGRAQGATCCPPSAQGQGHARRPRPAGRLPQETAPAHRAWTRRAAAATSSTSRCKCCWTWKRKSSPSPRNWASSSSPQVSVQQLARHRDQSLRLRTGAGVGADRLPAMAARQRLRQRPLARAAKPRRLPERRRPAGAPLPQQGQDVEGSAGRRTRGRRCA